MTTTTTTTTMANYYLREVHRRIRNLLDAYPASSWTLEESQAVLAAVEGIVRARPAGERLPGGRKMT